MSLLVFIILVSFFLLVFTMVMICSKSSILISEFIESCFFLYFFNVKWCLAFFNLFAALSVAYTLTLLMSFIPSSKNLRANQKKIKTKKTTLEPPYDESLYISMLYNIIKL